ncbi:hypothetical protein PR003_g18592 [Phytophthora rubi]|uniref:Uncharacterized protein n=1 Tax=Phytophthora rubi TaxID=129364 RepID=A0A6A4ECU7_9STRA|nr:hypothetical protein PR003_g18592 [Phytophthora rubi]
MDIVNTLFGGEHVPLSNTPAPAQLLQHKIRSTPRSMEMTKFD